MADEEGKSNTVRVVIIALASVGCTGLVTIAGVAFFVLYSCSQGSSF